MLSDNEKWTAVIQSNPLYDGEFYYGVKTTGIFCRPSCKSKPPRRENVEFFLEPNAAIAGGLRPCKRCRPDLVSYDPATEMVFQARKIYESHYDDRENLESELKKLSISQSHLNRLFRSRFGTTPTEFANTLRIKKAASCLQKNGQSVLSIALTCGFGSLSGFYSCFMKKFGMTPCLYRKKHSSPQQSHS